MEHRSAFDGILGMIGGLPQGHDKPAKHALYNAMALFILFVCIAAIWALFLVLGPFVKPLLWALLIGSVLHPLKRTLRDRFNSWFSKLEASDTPVVFGITLLPFNIVNDISELLGNILLRRLKFVAAVGVSTAVSLIMYQFTPTFIYKSVWSAALFAYASLNFFIGWTNMTMVSVSIVLHLLMVFLFWRPENNSSFHSISMVLWLFLAFFVTQYFGALRVPAFILIQLVLCGGFIWEVYDVYNECQPITIWEAAAVCLYKSSEQVAMESELNKSDSMDGEENRNTDDMLRKRRELHRSISQPHISVQADARLSLLISRRMSLIRSRTVQAENAYGDSTVYLYVVFWACISMILWRNIVLLPLIFIPIAFYCVKHGGRYFGIWSYLYDQTAFIVVAINEWCALRHDAIVPVPIRGFYKVIARFNTMVKNFIKSSIDTVASLCVITLLIVLFICASLFIAFQIYAEAIMLVQMTSNVLNQTVVHNPELRHLLPPAWDEAVDSILDNAYQYGREGISRSVRSMMSDVDVHKSEKLERQILELWDRLYQSWMMSADTSAHGPKVTTEAIKVSWENVLNDLRKYPELLNVNGIVDFCRQNVGMLMSLLDSVWAIVKGNVGLILGSVSALLSILLDGSTAVFNFIISGIVFFTALFYLLNCSTELYKPVQLLTNFSTNGKRFGHALEAAVNGVFTASLKMAAFYGLWTWFIHNIFSVKIVYLPTVFAMAFGAAPFLGTYWACFPAVLDLWLAQGKGLQAVLVAVCQFVPTYFVDTAIYSEIKGGGHPYLTGLAIAGGIFCLGIEGAIFGPLLLCGIYVAIDLSSSLFKESPSEELNLRMSLQPK